MPEYEFETPTGEIITKEYPRGEAPACGSQVDINGTPCTRVFSTVRQTNRRYEHVAHSLPPNDPEVKIKDAHGQPVFTSRKSIDEYKARTGRTYS